MQVSVGLGEKEAEQREREVRRARGRRGEGGGMYLCIQNAAEVERNPSTADCLAWLSWIYRASCIKRHSFSLIPLHFDIEYFDKRAAYSNFKLRRETRLESTAKEGTAGRGSSVNRIRKLIKFYNTQSSV